MQRRHSLILATKFCDKSRQRNSILCGLLTAIGRGDLLCVALRGPVQKSTHIQNQSPSSEKNQSDSAKLDFLVDTFKKSAKSVKGDDPIRASHLNNATQNLLNELRGSGCKIDKGNPPTMTILVHLCRCIETNVIAQFIRLITTRDHDPLSQRQSLDLPMVSSGINNTQQHGSLLDGALADGTNMDMQGSHARNAR